jgi:tetratricopeptide (TPR) repeat protein
MGEKTEARDAFEKYASLGGDMSDLYGPLVDCYMSTGQTSKAVDTIKEGIAQGTQEAWLYSLWGKIMEKSKNYDGAIEKFSKAVQLQEQPWSDYAKKQIARQSKLKKREQMMASQMSE